VLDFFQAKRLCSSFHSPANPAHSKDSKDLALRIVTKINSLLECPFPQSSESGIKLADGTKEQEES
jgi:hypothetical protein